MSCSLGHGHRLSISPRPRKFRTHPSVWEKIDSCCNTLISRVPSWPETGANRCVTTNEMGGSMNHCGRIVHFVRIHSSVFKTTRAQTLPCFVKHVIYACCWTLYYLSQTSFRKAIVPFLMEWIPPHHQSLSGDKSHHGAHGVLISRH